MGNKLWKNERHGLQVRQDLCLGCGLCAQSCPQGAITFLGGQAWIDNKKCISCGECIEVCPQGAIRKKIPVSVGALGDEIQQLHWRVDDVMVRIEKLRARG